MVLLILIASVVGGEMGKTFLFNPLLWIIPLQISGFLMSRALYVISHGVLAFTATSVAARMIPLAKCDIRKEKRQWRLRWAEGRRRPDAAIPNVPELTDLLLAAMETAPQVAPETENQAELTISFASAYRWSWKHWVLLVTMATGIGLAFWLDQPLYMLAVVGLPVLAYFERPRYVVLTPDALWIVEAERPPVAIERATVKVAWVKSKPQLQIPDQRSIKLDRHMAAGLIRRLEHGDTPFDPPTVKQAPAESKPRCSLCGRPLADAGTVQFCDACANRTRLEATDTGAGLTGRDRKPM